MVQHCTVLSKISLSLLAHFILLPFLLSLVPVHSAGISAGLTADMFDMYKLSTIVYTHQRDRQLRPTQSDTVLTSPRSSRLPASYISTHSHGCRSDISRSMSATSKRDEVGRLEG